MWTFIRPYLKALSQLISQKSQRTAAIWVALMNRKAEAEKLLKDTWGMYHRYHGMDSMLLASPLALWPPPLRLVFPNNKAEKDVLVCWEVKFNRTPEKEELCR
jgi:hypothetical protein